MDGGSTYGTRIGRKRRHNDGNRRGRIFDRSDRRVPACQIISTLRRTKIGRERRQPIGLTLGVSILYGDVLSIYVAKLK